MVLAPVSAHNCGVTSALRGTQVGRSWTQSSKDMTLVLLRSLPFQRVVDGSYAIFKRQGWFGLLGFNASATAKNVDNYVIYVLWQQPGSYQGGEMMMKSVFWWRKPEYPEETTDLRQVTKRGSAHEYECKIRLPVSYLH